MRSPSRSVVAGVLAMVMIGVGPAWALVHPASPRFAHPAAELVRPTSALGPPSPRFAHSASALLDPTLALLHPTLARFVHHRQTNPYKCTGQQVWFYDWHPGADGQGGYGFWDDDIKVCQGPWRFSHRWLHWTKDRMNGR